MRDRDDSRVMIWLVTQPANHIIFRTSMSAARAATFAGACGGGGGLGACCAFFRTVGRLTRDAGGSVGGNEVTIGG